jgi:hypothetical protein
VTETTFIQFPGMKRCAVKSEVTRGGISGFAGREEARKAVVREGKGWPGSDIFE